MLNKKYFIITIDTEGDNLWAYRMGNDISTLNARYIPRFQELCNKYNYKPVYLVNYEMANDDYFVDFAKDTLNRNNGEIGLHLHAWNTPPHYEIPEQRTDYGLPYLIEYPEPVMREKFQTMFKLIGDKFQNTPTSHRSGRWAMNQDYFDILMDYRIKIDCSVTPHVSWESSKGLSIGSKGSDYRSSLEYPFTIKHSKTDDVISEIPVTIRMLHRYSFVNPIHVRSFYSNIKSFIQGKPVWLRPTGNNLKDMTALIDYVKKSDSYYLMFMLHSSELMPGGSPTFRNTESIEKLYNDLTIIFDIIAPDFTGITLKDYYSIKKEYNKSA
ncbi:deacetylase [Spirochaetia bacterium]|nr:deacetylase [Spirochaetia bacterium]